MKTLFIKEVKIKRIIRFLRPISLCIFIISIIILLLYSWPDNIYKIEGIVQREFDCKYTAGRIEDISAYCLYINNKRYYLEGRGWIEIQERRIVLEGHHVEIMCYDSQDPWKSATFIEYLKIDGELIWDGRDDNKPIMKKSLIFFMISVFFVGMDFYYERKEKRKFKKVEEK